MASKILKMYPMTEYPFDHNKERCRVCRRKLNSPREHAHDALFTIFYLSLCSLECLITMHKANEEQLDLMLEWSHYMLDENQDLREATESALR